jgi:hypothetical protein
MTSVNRASTVEPASDWLMLALYVLAAISSSVLLCANLLGLLSLFSLFGPISGRPWLLLWSACVDLLSIFMPSIIVRLLGEQPHARLIISGMTILALVVVALVNYAVLVVAKVLVCEHCLF